MTKVLKMSNQLHIYEFPLQVLKYLGFWRVSSKNPYVRAYYTVHQTYAIFSFSAYVAFCCADLYRKRHDVQKVSTNLSLTISIFIVFFKTGILLLQCLSIQSLKNELQEGLHEKRETEEEGLLKKSVKEIKTAYVVVYGMFIMTVTVWMFNPLILSSKDGKPKFPMPLFTPWPNEYTPMYEITYFYHVYSSYFAALDIISINVVFFAFIIGIVTEYDILMKNTRRINEWYEQLCVENEENKILSEEMNKTVAKMIEDIIRHHQKIIHSVNKLENCFSQMMVVQFIGAAIVFTVLALDIILCIRTLNPRLGNLVVYLSTVFIDTYLFCSLGDRLIAKHEEFTNTVYEIPWESMDVRNQKSIYLMMQRIKRPAKFTIQKFATMNLRTTLKMGKAIYNLLYLLLQVAEKKNS